MSDKNKNVLFIGGDRRNVYLYEQMRTMDYDNLHAYGLAVADIQQEELPRAIAAADTVILPIPSARNGIVPLAAVESAMPLAEVLDAMREGASLAGGFLDPAPQKAGIQVIDLFASEEFQTLNAWPTAEGAVRIALERSEQTLRDSRCTVIGYGKVGKALVQLLHAFGSDVIATARRPEQLAEIAMRGANPMPTRDLAAACNGSNFIFNTVPVVLLREDVLHSLRRDVCIIDLASAPYGIDFNAATRLKLDAQPYPSLPGRMFPKSAAGIIYHCIQDLL